MQARDTLCRRLETRRQDFLYLVRYAAYENIKSPYRSLLREAHCELGDVERLVGQEGVEGALGVLFRHGVYLTVDEFKGRRPAIRGSSTIWVKWEGLRNSHARYHLFTQSGGSRGVRTPVPIDLDHIRDRTVNASLYAEARGGLGWEYAFWGPPGGWPIFQFLVLSGFGSPPVRWFSQVDPDIAGLSPLYLWSSRAVQWGSAAAGVVAPTPEYVPLDNPLPVARWMVEVLQSGKTPHLHTFTSPAVLLCQAAATAGISLRGAQFRLGGEPTTPARLKALHQVGANGVASYGVNEAGEFIAQGCLSPTMPDDVHFYHDLHALIQPDSTNGNSALPPNALLLSSLRPTAPLVLLNVSMGDQAVVTRRACGCPLQTLGWTTHLHTIRSYEKLTAGGIMLLDSDVVHVLEEVLPARFGGGPTDYQLQEDETEDGRPRLRLVVHPAIGPLEPEAVLDAFLGAIGSNSGGERVAEVLWRQAGVVHVERRVPERTSAGKIHHLHTTWNGYSKA